jgi:hypothetical protein
MDDEAKQNSPLLTLEIGDSSATKYTDPKEKRLASWLEDITFMQKVNLVLLLLTLLMLALHLLLDFYFHV